MIRRLLKRLFHGTRDFRSPHDALAAADLQARRAGRARTDGLTDAQGQQLMKDQTVRVLVHQAMFTIQGGACPCTLGLQEALDSGGSPNPTEPDGEPLLVWLARQPLDLLSFPMERVLPPTLDLVQRLLDAGADPNQADAHGRTPLERASTPGMVRTLARAGARLDVGRPTANVWSQALGSRRAVELTDVWHRAHEERDLRLVADACPMDEAPAPPRRRL